VFFKHKYKHLILRGANRVLGAIALPSINTNFNRNPTKWKKVISVQKKGGMRRNSNADADETLLHWKLYK